MAHTIFVVEVKVWLLLLGCAPRAPYIAELNDSDSPESAGDTAEEEVEPSVWDDPAFFAEAGPFAPLLDMSLAPERSHWEVWLFTSSDGVSWSDGVAIAHSFSSLDLLIMEQGIVLGGSAIPDTDGGINAPFEHFFALTSPDLVQWGSKLWPIRAATHRQIVDPSLHLDPDGTVRMVFFGASDDVNPRKNPEEYPGDHSIYTATWDGDGFIQAPEPLFAEEDLVDPSGCYWQGRHQVLSTGDGRLYSVSADVLGGEYTEDALDWGAVQVPYCLIDGDEQWIVAQAGGGFGPPQARTRGPGEDFSAPFLIIEEADIPLLTCTSPVMGRFQGQHVLFCATWK
jgi:hypothetical protein